MNFPPGKSIPNVHSARAKVVRWLAPLIYVSVAWYAYGQYDSDWARHFRIGAVGGFNIKASLRPITGGFDVKGSKNGIYDDGYVIPERANTEDDFTPNWGYNDASQFDGSTLTMHQSTSFIPTTATLAKEDSSIRAGFELEYGGNLWYWKQLRFGWDLGIGFMPIQVSDNQPMTGTVGRSIFTFDTGSLILFPPAGHRGQAGGDGANIHSTPTPAGTDNPAGDATLSGTRTLDVILYTIRFGPSVFWDLNDHIGLSVGAGPALGIISGNYRFNETLVLDGNSTVNKGHFGATDIVYGGYITATVTYHAVRNGDVYLSAQYMPLGSTTFSSGGRAAKLDLSGALFISGGINWPF